MKICLITSRLPPVLCGVGDHTVQLANYFAARGDEVCVLTTADQAATIPGAGFQVKPALPSWSILSMPRLWKILRRSRPDVIVLQWVPFLYSHRGTNLALPLTLSLLSLTGANVQIMVHEPWVSFIRPSFFVTGPIQRLALGMLVRTAKKISVSTAAWTEMLRSIFPGRRDRIHTVPVVSNIPVAKGNRAELRKAAGLPDSAVVLGAFSLHGAAKLFSLLDSTWRKVSDERNDVYLVVFGADDEASRRELPSLVGHPRCRFTGYLPPEKISAWFQTVDLLLAPFSDGITTRRTSVISAMAHGVPVVTTQGRLTDPALFGGSPLVLSSQDPEAFFSETMKLVDSEPLRRSLGARTKAFHQEHFELSRVGEALIPVASPHHSRKATAG